MGSKIKCYSVRLKNLTQITSKCWKAEDWEKNTYLIPDSQYFGRDYEVKKSDAYWISCFIIDKKDCFLQVSVKKIGWYNLKTKIIEPPFDIEITHYTPEKINPVENNTIKDLKK